MRALTCKYCSKKFYGRVRNFKKHIRYHEKKYHKHWTKRRKRKQQEANVGDKSKTDSATKDRKEPMRDRLFVYIVYAPKGTCDCSKENQPERMPCYCDFTYKKMVYSSVAQMHHGLQTVSSYDCLVCKKKVPPVLRSKNGKVPPKISCNKCNDVFSTNQDLHVHQLACLGFKKTGQTFACQQCDAQVKYREDMVKHASVVHSIYASSKSGPSRKKRPSICPTPSICPVCGKIYPTSKLLKAHIWLHPRSLQTGLVCCVCGYRADDAFMLAQHSKLHVASNRKQVVASESKENRPGVKQKKQTPSHTLAFGTNEMNSVRKGRESIDKATKLPIQLNNGMRLRPRKQLTLNIDLLELETSVGA